MDEANQIRRSRLARARRPVILVIGSLLLVIGAVLLVLPGPGLLLILGGLAVLGREVAWARRLQQRIESIVRRRQRRATEESSLSVRNVIE